MSLLKYLAVAFATTIVCLTHVSAQESANLGVDYTIIGGGRVSGLYFPRGRALRVVQPPERHDAVLCRKQCRLFCQSTGTSH